MKNIIAVLAGGSGKRVGSNLPKQFIKIAGKTLIEHTLEIFESHTDIHEIMVVVHRDYEKEMLEIQKRLHSEKWKKTVLGGEERFHSAWAAIQACEPDDNAQLLIHDAARPFVSAQLIDKLLDALESHPAVIPVLPVTDTLVEVRNDIVQTAPNRKIFRQVQTPEAFKLEIIRHAYAIAIKDLNCCVTDDCSVILHYLPQIAIKTVIGEKENLKLTYQSDIELFEKIFEEKTKK